MKREALLFDRPAELAATHPAEADGRPYDSHGALPAPYGVSGGRGRPGPPRPSGGPRRFDDEDADCAPAGGDLLAVGIGHEVDAEPRRYRSPEGPRSACGTRDLA